MSTSPTRMPRVILGAGLCIVALSIVFWFANLLAIYSLAGDNACMADSAACDQRLHQTAVRRDIGVAGIIIGASVATLGGIQLSRIASRSSIKK